MPSDTTPRVRGLRITIAVAQVRSGYNPACAGTTSCTFSTTAVTAIQPRVCGDYHVDGWHCYHRTDTTPRVRGLRPARARRWRPTRYNPACAGTTYEHYTQKQESTIQPRVCGDYRLTSCRRISGFDTTPRVRGLRYLKERRKNKNRYNPACAGTTRATDSVLTVIRYNPACAGTTCDCHISVLSCSIQPRVCGDYLQAPARAGAQVRYNPACAGTTPKNLWH